MSDCTASDETLMLSAGKGDMGAFEHLVYRHQSAAWGFAWRFIGDADEAEDLVQEAFLHIFNAAERYKPVAAFRTYLYRVLMRLCIDHARKKSPVLMDSLPDVADPGPSQAEQVENKEREAAIQKALSALAPNYRMVIILRYFEGMSGAEVARVMNTTPKGVERLLARARANLEPLLRPIYENNR